MEIMGAIKGSDFDCPSMAMSAADWLMTWKPETLPHALI